MLDREVTVLLLAALLAADAVLAAPELAAPPVAELPDVASVEAVLFLLTGEVVGCRGGLDVALSMMVIAFTLMCSDWYSNDARNYRYLKTV